MEHQRRVMDGMEAEVFCTYYLAAKITWFSTVASPFYYGNIKIAVSKLSLIHDN